MKLVVSLTALLFVAASLQAGTVYDQPLSGSGALHASSWVDPDGTDSDMFVYDNFTLPQAQQISEVRWYGGYQYGAPYGRVHDFTITFYGSIAVGTEPDVTYKLKQYRVNSNAGETFYGSFGGTSIYSYSFKLPTTFAASANTKYWVQIEGWQPGYPDWGLADGAGGDSQHFRFSRGYARYNFMTGDAAFSLLTPTGSSFNISATVAPAGSGTVTGSGTYKSGAAVNLDTQPKLGYTFVNWTENGLQVSTQSTYNFTATANRTLVTHLVPTLTALKPGKSTIVGGKTATGTITLGAPAIEPVAVHMVSSSPLMLGTQDPIWIPAGASSATFTVSTASIPNDCYATLTASLGPISKTVRILVKAPTPSGVALTPSILTGGASVKVKVSINTTAPGSGYSVYLTSSDPSVKIANPYVWINGGTTSTTVTLPTSAVTVQTLATISATANGVTKSKVLTINP